MNKHSDRNIIEERDQLLLKFRDWKQFKERNFRECELLQEMYEMNKKFKMRSKSIKLKSFEK